MLEPPKDLPPLNPPKGPLGTQETAPALPSANQLSLKTEMPKINPTVTKTLPKAPDFPRIELPRSQTITIGPPTERTTNKEEDETSFDEAIKNLHFNITSAESPGDQEQGETAGKEAYYAPKQLGEGYFSEIRHYLKNKDVNQIIDDVLKKDFLTGMKDYHDQKAQGKPFYFHNQDLKDKLETKMNMLMAKEESWHELDQAIETSTKKKQRLERDIDAESQELKELFKLIKTNQILEKECKEEEQFILRSGTRLKNLNDLRKALSYMQEDEFRHHVNDQKNDFSAWIRGALGLPEISEKMQGAKTKEELTNKLKNVLD
ncbi:hypothetical protein JW826_05230 [Candidatus Woesearchaeota archaeon]|nr:hypothetical protein [Candidatus Woesearchaeota archaeon]